MRSFDRPPLHAAGSFQRLRLARRSLGQIDRREREFRIRGDGFRRFVSACSRGNRMEKRNEPPRKPSEKRTTPFNPGMAWWLLAVVGRGVGAVCLLAAGPSDPPLLR